jgi:hypothetical protein
MGKVKISKFYNVSSITSRLFTDKRNDNELFNWLSMTFEHEFWAKLDFAFLILWLL